MMTAGRWGRGLAGQALVFLAFFVAWEAAVHVFGFKEVILPTPTTTFVDASATGHTPPPTTTKATSPSTAPRSAEPSSRPTCQPAR